MEKFSTINVFDYKVYADSRKNLLRYLSDNIYNIKNFTIISLNTLKTYLASKDNKIDTILKSSSIIIPDGQSVVFAGKILGQKVEESISGAELMVELIKMANQKKLSIYFLGSKKELLDKVKLKIMQEYSNIKAEYQHGYYDIRDESEIVKQISKFAPNILFVAFGSPRKEEFIHSNLLLLNANVLMGVGGSYEYFVGDVKLDNISKKLGLRWLIRVFQDPVRLLPRYMKCNSHFVYLLSKNLLKKLLKTSPR